MQQMDAGEAERKQQEMPYGRYDGNQGYQPPYETGSPPPYEQPPMFDDAFVDAFAQRLSQRMAQGPQGKLHPPSAERLSAQQRLALAIVSVIMMAVFSTGIIVGGGASLGALIGAGVLDLAIFLINAVINDKA